METQLAMDIASSLDKKDVLANLTVTAGTFTANSLLKMRTSSGDTDPQKTGVPPLPAQAEEPGSQKTADLFNRWIELAREILREEPKANALTLRGFSKDPKLPQFPEIYGR